VNDGVKFDDSKIRWGLLPWAEIQDILEILEFGAKKYEEDNWKKVNNADDRYFNAAMRHFISWKKGEKADPETGKSHLAHLACNILFLMYHDKNN